MIGNIQRIKENLAKRLKELRPKAKDGRIAGGDLDPLLHGLREQYPNLPVFQSIPHPRDNHFSIYILPLPQPLPEILQPAITDLQNQMTQDGVSPDLRKAGGYEQRQSHLWVAEFQRWSYHPIGVCTFLEETRRRDNEVRTNHWLSHVWLNLAQRNHNVLRNSVEYFQKWHPRFVVSRDHGIINRSLKNHPQHLQNGRPSDAMWE